MERSIRRPHKREDDIRQRRLKEILKAAEDGRVIEDPAVFLRTVCSFVIMKAAIDDVETAVWLKTFPPEKGEVFCFGEHHHESLVHGSVA